MKIKEQPYAIRPREKMLKHGADYLLPEELIGIIISTGMKGRNAIQIGEDIIQKFGENLLTATVEDLSKIKGLGQVKAIKLKSAFELGLRYSQHNNDKIVISSSKDVFALLHEYIDKKQEHFLLLCLNTRNQLISKKVITIGTLDSSLFHPREVFAEAIADRAAKIIVAHNHPSGSLVPSSNDNVMTKKIKEAGEILGITLVDSVIISCDGYKSIIKE